MALAQGKQQELDVAQFLLDIEQIEPSTCSCGGICLNSQICFEWRCDQDLPRRCRRLKYAMKHLTIARQSIYSGIYSQKSTMPPIKRLSSRRATNSKSTTAKVFLNGASQAVRLPKEFRFDDDEVCIKRIGTAVLLFPKESAWQLLADAMGKADDDFLPARGEPKRAERRRRL